MYPMAASEHSNLHNLRWSDRRLWGNLSDGKGHPRDLPLLGFIAEKQSSRFRFPEAVVPSRQERALCRHWQEMEADVRRLVTPSFINDAIRNGIDYVTSSVLH